MASNTACYYHVSDSDFQIGDKIKCGRYGDSTECNNLSDENDPNGEWLREHIRKEFYPDKPSRLSCIYIFDNEQDAVRFRDTFRVGHKIYKVIVTTENPSMHRVCYTAWSMDYPNLDQQAHSFWKDPAIYSTNTETFVESDLEVIALTCL